MTIYTTIPAIVFFFLLFFFFFFFFLYFLKAKLNLKKKKKDSFISLDVIGGSNADLKETHDKEHYVCTEWGLVGSPADMFSFLELISCNFLIFFFSF